MVKGESFNGGGGGDGVGHGSRGLKKRGLVGGAGGGEWGRCTRAGVDSRSCPLRLRTCEVNFLSDGCHQSNYCKYVEKT